MVRGSGGVWRQVTAPTRAAGARGAEVQETRWFRTNVAVVAQTEREIARAQQNLPAAETPWLEARLEQRVRVTPVTMAELALNSFYYCPARPGPGGRVCGY